MIKIKQIKFIIKKNNCYLFLFNFFFFVKFYSLYKILKCTYIKKIIIIFFCFFFKKKIEKNEKTVCTGTSNEIRTAGGEVAFITSIIADSLILKTWFFFIFFYFFFILTVYYNSK
jgi:hypothetical protein